MNRRGITVCWAATFTTSRKIQGQPISLPQTEERSSPFFRRQAPSLLYPAIAYLARERCLAPRSFKPLYASS